MKNLEMERYPLFFSRLGSTQHQCVAERICAFNSCTILSAEQMFVFKFVCSPVSHTQKGWVYSVKTVKNDIQMKL